MFYFNISVFQKAITNAMLWRYALHIENEEFKKESFNDENLVISIEKKQVSKEVKEKLHELKALTHNSRINWFIQDKREKLISNKKAQRKIEKDFKDLLKYSKKNHLEIYKYMVETGKLTKEILTFNKQYIKEWGTLQKNPDWNTKKKTTPSKIASIWTKGKGIVTTTKKRTEKYQLIKS